MFRGFDVVHSRRELDIFLGTLSISTAIFTVVFMLPRKARMSRTIQRGFAGLALFSADGLLLLGSLADAQNFIFPFIACLGFNSWLLMELDLQLPLPDWVVHLTPATVGRIATVGGFTGLFFFGYTPKFASMLCGASSLLIAFSMLSFWLGTLPSRTMLGYMSSCVAMQALVFVVLHKVETGACLGLWALVGFVKCTYLPVTEHWFGDDCQ